MKSKLIIRNGQQRILPYVSSVETIFAGDYNSKLYKGKSI
jgi:hypothetical protein